MAGEVVIVGAGPGDPELITLRGLKELRSAEVVLYDRLVSPALLREAPAGALLINVGKMPGHHPVPQERINHLQVEHASQGKKVVRLKGGDPYTFGRGEEECIHVLSHGIPCRVVPGVPSYVAASVLAGIPLTNRRLSSSFAVATGREDPRKGEKRVDLRQIASAVDTLVVLMGVGEARRVLSEVAEARGWGHPAAAVVDASLPTQEVIVGDLRGVLEAAEGGRLRSPAVMVFGETIQLREKLCGGPAARYC